MAKPGFDADHAHGAREFIQTRAKYVRNVGHLSRIIGQVRARKFG
jgi:hypothetical protein